MFISGDENVYPAEVEGVLATHPAIAEVAVIAQPDPKWGEVGLAIVVLRTTGRITAAEVIAFWLTSSPGIRFLAEWFSRPVCQAMQ